MWGKRCARLTELRFHTFWRKWQFAFHPLFAITNAFNVCISKQNSAISLEEWVLVFKVFTTVTRKLRVKVTVMSWAWFEPRPTVLEVKALVTRRERRSMWCWVATAPLFVWLEKQTGSLAKGLCSATSSLRHRSSNSLTAATPSLRHRSSNSLTTTPSSLRHRSSNSLTTTTSSLRHRSSNSLTAAKSSLRLRTCNSLTAATPEEKRVNGEEETGATDEHPQTLGRSLWWFSKKTSTPGDRCWQVVARKSSFEKLCISVWLDTH